jgi:mRNA deadenylase 3'-5' endonuclease subunit Ccr4
MRLRVVSYNVLAQSLALSAYFTGVPKAVLRSKHRSARLRQQFAAFDADVLCLQEVERFDTVRRCLFGWGSVRAALCCAHDVH